MSGLFTGVCTTILTISLLAPSARADELSLMPKPSDENVAGLLRLECGHAPFPDCTKLVQELVDGKPGSASVIGIKDVGKEIAEGIYEGKLYPNGRKDATGALRENEVFGKPPICSGVPVVFSGSGCKEEFQKNHLDQDCGKPFIVKWSSSSPGYYSNIQKSNGSRETSHFAGIYLAALSNAFKKIESEVLSNRLSIPSGACAGQAADLKDLITKHKNMVNVNKLSSCDPKNLNECSAMKYFQAAFESIRSAYLMIARCRMIDEASREQREFVSTARSSITTEAIQPCVQSCGNNASCINTCYQTKYKHWLENAVKTKFPKAAEGC